MNGRIRIIPLLAAALLVLAGLAGGARADMEIDAKAIIGPYCFSLDNYTDTWHWQVDAMGNGYIQVTGFDEVIPSTAMTGGGFILGNTLYLSVVESYADTGWRAIHAIELDLTTYTGTDDFSWYDQNGALVVSYFDEPFSQAICWMKSARDLPASCPLPADGEAAAPAPEQIGGKTLSGWQCFTLDNYSDTWELFFVDMGGGAQQVTGYDTVYYGSAMFGGGFQIGDHLYLVLTESYQTAGDRCIHRIELDLATMTGVSTFVWRTYDETPNIPYFREPFHACPKQAGSRDLPPSLPGAELRTPPAPAIGDQELKTILGEYCFSFDYYADVWHWDVDLVGPGVFEVTGYNEYLLDEAMNGGGHLEGNKAYLNVITGITDTGQRSFMAIDLDLDTWTGVADFTYQYVDGTFPLSYQDEPFTLVPCGLKSAGDPVSALPPMEGEKSRATGPVATVLTVDASPNPFNPRTVIRFNLPRTGLAEVGVYDLSGRLVRRLASEVFPAGPNQVAWDGRDAAGRLVASGVYFVNVACGAERASSRLVMLK